MIDARQLVLRFGWNSTCYQVLNEGFSQWFTAKGTALVGYVKSGRTVIVAGAPVSSASDLDETIVEWEAFAEARNDAAGDENIFSMMGV